MAPLPRFLPCGDRGLTIELGSSIDPGVNALVVALDAALAAAAMPGVVETVPTYRSLLVVFEPRLIRRRALEAAILALWPSAARPRTKVRRWHVPVAYGGAFGVDLGEVAAIHGLTEAAVVERHAAPLYRVAMIGFAPGFAYLDGLPPDLATGRLSEPRGRVPSGTVSIGGAQTGVSPPLELPSGWRLIGRTPVRSYDLSRTERPFLFEAGDEIRFDPIAADSFAALAARAAAGEIVARLEAPA